MRSYAFVLASMSRYSWLITFEIFHNFFCFGYRIQSLFGFFFFFIFTRPPALVFPMVSTKKKGEKEDTEELLLFVNTQLGPSSKIELRLYRPLL